MKKAFVAFVLCVTFSTAFAGWQPVSSPVTAHLRSICYVDPMHIYAAGSDGVIIQYDGVTWTEMTSGTTKNINAIAMLNADDGWAVGVEGLVLRYSAGTWELFPTASETRTYNSILGFSSDDVYMLSYSLVEGSTLHHWDGSDLSDIRIFSDNMTCLEGTGPDDLWVAGGTGSIHHFDGTTWDSSFSSLPESTKIFSLVLNESGNPVVTGVRLPGWDVDMILEYLPGTGWTQVWRGYEKRIITSIINEKRGFAMGASGRVIEQSIFGWQEITGPVSIQINDVVLPTMADGWAVTDQGGILRYTQPSINLSISSNEVAGGDKFELSYGLMNPGGAVSDLMHIMFLEAYGMFLFWPSWTEDFNFEMIDMAADYSQFFDLFAFNWPQGAGTGTVAFWAALLDSQNNILGYDIEGLSWTD